MDRLGHLLDFTKQPKEAEKVIHEAETKLAPLQAPMALALCCEKMGQFYDSSGNATEMKKWNDAATNWYEKAEAAQPDDLSIKRRLTEFFLRTKQIDEAHKYLEAIRKQNNGAKNAETAAWANRTLAFVLASGTDRTQVSKALSLFEPDGQSVPAGQEGKTPSMIPKICGFLLEFSTCKKPLCTAKEPSRSWKIWRTRISPLPRTDFP